MRTALDHLTHVDHRGLAYDVGAPLDSSGKVDKERLPDWLDKLCKPHVPDGYEQAFARWRSSFRRGRDVGFEACTDGRLLIGHGNPAPTEVGITLHHTWGVPIIPGSALKGLTAHFVAASYGADPGENDPERAPFAGPVYKAGRVIKEPGEVFRRLFGAPAVSVPGGDVPASRGEVVFHDALWIPDGSKPWLARDVLTVHQKTYYQGRDRLPNDWDEPNPVTFLSVPAGVAFLVALSCEDDALLSMAERFAREALCEWGIGGKTGAGYGRMSGLPVLVEFENWLREQKQVTQAEQLERIERMWLERLQALSPAEHEHVKKLLVKQINSPKRKKQREDLIRRVCTRA